MQICITKGLLYLKYTLIYQPEGLKEDNDLKIYQILLIATVIVNLSFGVACLTITARKKIAY